MKARIFFFTLVALIVLLATVYVSSTRPISSHTDTALTVTTSFYPLAHFAEQVGGSRVHVINLTPAGAEPHNYEPSPRDLAKLESSNILLLNGNGLESWGDKVKQNLVSTKVQVIVMGDSIDSIQTIEAESTSKTLDPHFWLDPVNAQKEVTVIRDAFIAADPAGTDEYRARASVYIGQLTVLDQQFRTGLATCSQKEGITSHAAFGYLSKRYGVQMIPIAGFSPDEEPSSKQIAVLADLARQKHITYILTETLVSSKLADTIAKEVGARTLVFNPLEGLSDQEIASGASYISVMQENLAHLRTALSCT